MLNFISRQVSSVTTKKHKKAFYKCHSNIAIFGSSHVGKTSIVQAFATSIYDSQEYKPTLTELYERMITLKSPNNVTCKHTVSLLDTSGTLRYDFPSTYRQAIESCEAFVLVFSLDDEDSLAEIEKILRDIDMLKKTTKSPVLIIANKADKATSILNEDFQLIKKLSNLNRGCCFRKSAVEESDFTECFVSLLTQIERRKGINRSFYGVNVIETKN